MQNFWTGFKEGMQKFGHHVGRVVNTTLLILIYFLAIGPTSLIAKLQKKKFLKLSLEKESNSYWEDLNLGKQPIEKYYKQF